MDDLSALREIELDASPVATSEGDRGLAPTSPMPAPIKFGLEPLRSIGLDRRPQWLINGLMPSSGLHVLYGAPGSGKSFVGLHAALHVASGRKWAGRDVRPGPVVYIASEGGMNFRRRVVAAKTKLGISDDAPFALVTRAPNLGGKRHDTSALIDDIKRQIAILGAKPVLIVLDTLARSIRDLRESDAQDIMEFVDNAAEISERFDDALVMPVHHTGKDESKGMRGSSALHGAADAEWLVSRDIATGARSISVEKMKDGQDQLRMKFTLLDHALGTDLAGAPMSTCVAEVFDAGAATAKTPKRKDGMTQADTIHSILRALIVSEGTAPPAGCNAPEGRKVVSRERLKAVFAEAFMPSGKTEAVTSAVTRALATLLEAKKAGGIEHVWLLDPET